MNRLTANGAESKTEDVVQKTTRSRAKNRNGQTLAVHDAAYTPSWKDQLHAVAGVHPTRERVAEPECNLWLAQIREALRTAEFVGTGRRPACMSGSYAHRLHITLREEAIALIAWSQSHEVGGLHWIGGVLESAAGITLDVVRIGELIRSQVGHVVAEPKPRRVVYVAPIARLRAQRDADGYHHPDLPR